MNRNHNRRRFFAASAAGLSAAGIFPGLTPIARSEIELEPSVVQFRPEIEPLVRLIEDTPREQLMEVVGRRVQNGLSYRQLLTALLLAGVRNVQPRPAVGFKFHAVLVVNSAHLASISSPDEDRWLPIFWALDNFKSSQARDVREGNWTMAPIRKSVIAPELARSEFDKAMQNWEEDKADVAAASLVRFSGAVEVFEAFARYAARDFRSIGHKAIFAANAWRTLQTIGWHHAEPVMRSLAYAMLNHNDESNPATNDLAADRPWRENQDQARSIRTDWMNGLLEDGATRHLITTLRTATPSEASAAVVEALNAGVAPQSVFDALHTAAGELLMRQPGIVALHAITTTNAIRFLFDTSGRDETRRLLILQNASFLPMFREAMKGRGDVGDVTIESLVSDSVTESDSAVGEIFRNVSSNRFKAAGGALRYLRAGNDATDLMQSARRLIFLKGTDSHDYKFSSALLEDYHKVSPAFRDPFLAAGMYRMRGSNDGDNGLTGRIQAAIG